MIEIYLLWRQLTQHFLSREPQDGGLLLADGAARVQLPDAPSHQQTPLQSEIELHREAQLELIVIFYPYIINDRIR